MSNKAIFSLFDTWFNYQWSHFQGSSTPLFPQSMGVINPELAIIILLHKNELSIHGVEMESCFGIFSLMQKSTFNLSEYFLH